MLNLAIIPARGGSKRIPRKNIKSFLGKPLISYSIEAALKAGCFSRVIVSTDCPEIASIAKEYGADVPWLRSSKNSNDHAGLAEVAIETLAICAEYGSVYPQFCLIMATAPLLTADRIIQGMELLELGIYDSVIPVVRFSYPPQRGLMVGPDGLITMIQPEQYDKRSQDLEPILHNCGQFYWMKTSALVSETRSFAKRTVGIALSEMDVQDNDTDDDWRMAETRYMVLNRRVESNP